VTGGFSAGYDADKRLTRLPAAKTMAVVYDGLGRCLKRRSIWETISSPTTGGTNRGMGRMEWLKA